MAETYQDYTLVQRVLDEQGYIIICNPYPMKGEVVPGAGSVIRGENIFHYQWGKCDGVKMVCVGEATLEEWLEQTAKFFPRYGKYGNTRRPDALFIKVVAE